MHALIFQTMTLGAGAPKRKATDETGPGSSAIVSSAELSMTLVLVQLPGVTRSSELRALASRGVAPIEGPIQVVSPDPTPAGDVQEASNEDDGAEASQEVGDPAARSLLFGRYTDQINARIERAWRKPRSAVSDQGVPSSSAESSDQGDENKQAGDFRCTVGITQDARGNVKEVELVSCNGSLAWQQSLIDAVQQASPLPAPPSPTVFTNALTLSFEGRSFQPGMAEDDYEPASYRLVQAPADVPVIYRSPQSVSASFEVADAPLDPGLPFDAPVTPRSDTEF